MQRALPDDGRHDGPLERLGILAGKLLPPRAVRAMLLVAARRLVARGPPPVGFRAKRLVAFGVQAVEEGERLGVQARLERAARARRESVSSMAFTERLPRHSSICTEKAASTTESLYRSVSM